MSNEHPCCDWFLGRDFSFICVHDFSGEPFCLPTHVTKRALALEIFRKLVEVEKVIGSRKHDTSIIEDHKAIGRIFLERKSITEMVLTSKLVQLGLVVIDNVWSYDLDGCLFNKHRRNAIKHVPQNSWEGRTNPLVNHPSLYIDPSDFPKVVWPPWLSFYTPL